MVPNSLHVMIAADYSYRCLWYYCLTSASIQWNWRALAVVTLTPQQIVSPDSSGHALFQLARHVATANMQKATQSTTASRPLSRLLPSCFGFSLGALWTHSHDSLLQPFASICSP
ncbi:hypothetical protein EDB89DRAFT_1907935 [Lactarius sanguifluus]|nr:hypothetical protein EDB89DRAFT_1907935 [Lactarius sanguifluus]